MMLSTSTLLLILRSSLFALPFLLMIYHWHKKRAPFVEAVDKIPGPKPLPFIGNALDMLQSPAELFNLFYTIEESFGPVFRFWVLDHPQVVIQRARDAEKILQNMTHHVKSMNYRFLHTWMGFGLLTSKDDKWRVHRKVLTPAFHFNILHEFLPIFNRNAQKLLECLAAEPKAESKEGFNIFHYSSRCSLDIICESAMGTVMNIQNNENSEYVHAVVSMNELLVRRYFSAWLRPDWIFNLSSTKREMNRHLNLLNNFTDQVVAERRNYLKSIKPINNNEKHNNDFGERRSLAFLDLLLAAEEEGSEHMTQKDIRDQVSTFMFEGHDTISTAISWFLFTIGSHPEHQERVVEELNEVFGESGRAPDMADLANLKYLERCIKETLRLYPSVAFIERSINEDCQIENYTIPAGSSASFNIYMLHRDPEFWPEPEKFDPDRFLPENVKGRHPYAYIPFSAGPRNCIGQKYAIMEDKAVVSAVLRRFRVEAAHKKEDAIMQIGMVLRPQNGLKVRMYEREDYPKLRISTSI